MPWLQKWVRVGWVLLLAATSEPIQLFCFLLIYCFFFFLIFSGREAVSWGYNFNNNSLSFTIFFFEFITLRRLFWNLSKSWWRKEKVYNFFFFLLLFLSTDKGDFLSNRGRYWLSSISSGHTISPREGISHHGVQTGVQFEKSPLLCGD